MTKDKNINEVFENETPLQNSEQEIQELALKIQELKSEKEKLESEKQMLTSQLEKLETENNTLKYEIEKLQLSSIEVNAQVFESNSKKGLEFEFRGQPYKFADDAPETILYQGESKTQKELTEDEEALVILIGGKSSLIEKI